MTSVLFFLETVTSVLYFLDRAVDELSSVTPGKEARAMTSFANALR